MAQEKTMTKYLGLAFLITGFLVGDAYGEEEEVFYCAETDNNGFQWNYKRQTYERRYFEAKKFKAKLNRTSNLVELKFKIDLVDLTSKLTCTTVFGVGPTYFRNHQTLLFYYRSQ